MLLTTLCVPWPIGDYFENYSHRIDLHGPITAQGRETKVCL
jgi:hypothetical protein